MGRNAILVLLVLGCYGLGAQAPISGQVDTALIGSGQHVYLSSEKKEPTNPRNQEPLIDSTLIDKYGFFAFGKTKLHDKDAMYRIYVKNVEQALIDTLKTEERFILSGKDKIRFLPEGNPFSHYHNTNKADLEWKRLKKYEASLQLNKQRKNKNWALDYAQGIRTYAKDSLQILMVKLIGIKQLDVENLLEKDIAKNPDYYVALLDELKSSELDRASYLFLENKLAFLTTEKATRKYLWSTYLNVLLGGALLVLAMGYFWRRRSEKRIDLSDLSKQERNIHQLILAGKSNKEIAGELFISLSTVKTHITHIYTKLHVSNRKELFRKLQN